ncbi:hypothetical protein [Pedobacter soli]|uniref:Uncharacterized protein n=1 Tax=Pedobacter soli TaxID=390242 RepID=A0A1G6Y7N0_9SPHI|nr:hypothetical protein [Pedobacter soli]SDD85973.1 hypothetical protein SAMN04488024_108175 [Pedobacter soli]
MTEKVLSVISSTLEILKDDPSTLVINAYGTVKTGGWSNGKLSPYVYIVPPADGIYEFDFVANKPVGIVTEVITPIHSKPYFLAKFPSDLKGVKIYASTNFIVETLP